MSMSILPKALNLRFRPLHGRCLVLGVLFCGDNCIDTPPAPALPIPATSTSVPDTTSGNSTSKPTNRTSLTSTPQVLTMKIYTDSTSVEEIFRVIDKPDKAGAVCDVQIIGVQLPHHNYSSLLTAPDWRLYDLDGSPCDTRGKPFGQRNTTSFIRSPGTSRCTTSMPSITSAKMV